MEEVLAELQEELKATKRQRIRDIIKHSDQEETLDESYDELESDLLHRISGLQNQIQMTADKRNTIIRVNRAAKTALEVFDDILNKEKLDRNDLELMIEKIKVYEDHLDIQLKADIDSLLTSGTLPEGKTANFNPGMEDISPITIIQTSEKRPDKVFHANVISNGERFLMTWLPEYTDVYDLLADFRFGGYRILSDLICDMDDENTARGRKQLIREGDSPAFVSLMEAYQKKPGSQTYREAVSSNCRRRLDEIIRPVDAAAYVVALGKRDSLWELLPDAVLPNVLEVHNDK